MKFTIRKKLFVSFGLSVLIPILLLCTILGIQLTKSARNSYINSANRELGHIDKSIDIFIGNAITMVTTLADNEIIKKADESLTSFIDLSGTIKASSLEVNALQADITKFFTLIGKHDKNYSEVYLGTKWGGFATSGTSDMPGGYDPRARPWYKKAILTPDSASLSSAYQFTNDAAGITIMHPVSNNTGTMAGVVGIDMELSGLTDFIKKIQLGESGYVVLAQEDGTILANPKYAETNFKPLKKSGISAYAELSDIDQGSLSLSIEGVDCIAVVHTMPGLKWKLIGVIERSEVMATVYGLIRTMLIIGVLVFIAFMGIALFLANSLTKPLNRTIAMLKDIAEGEGDLTMRLTAGT